MCCRAVGLGLQFDSFCSKETTAPPAGTSGYHTNMTSYFFGRNACETIWITRDVKTLSCRLNRPCVKCLILHTHTEFFQAASPSMRVATIRLHLVFVVYFLNSVQERMRSPGHLLTIQVAIQIHSITLIQIQFMHLITTEVQVHEQYQFLQFT